MFNFKEVADKCVNGELKGVFLIFSNYDNILYNLPSTSISRTPSGEYELSCGGISPTMNNPAGLCTMRSNGISLTGIYKAIDFIQETSIGTKELKIQIPENHEIDWQESAKQEKIVFKRKKDTKPRSWEEYCKNNEDKQVWFVREDSSIGTCHLMCRSINEDKNTLPTKELAESFLVMMQLMSLRQAWIGDWKPDWTGNSTLWCISNYMNNDVRNKGIIVTAYRSDFKSLSFPTREIATDFMNTFKDLLEVAKPLI